MERVLEFLDEGEVPEPSLNQKPVETISEVEEPYLSPTTLETIVDIPPQVRKIPEMITGLVKDLNTTTANLMRMQTIHQMAKETAADETSEDQEEGKEGQEDREESSEGNSRYSSDEFSESGEERCGCETDSSNDESEKRKPGAIEVDDEGIAIGVSLSERWNVTDLEVYHCSRGIPENEVQLKKVFPNVHKLATKNMENTRDMDELVHNKNSVVVKERMNEASTSRENDEEYERAVNVKCMDVWDRWRNAEIGQWDDTYELMRSLKQMLDSLSPQEGDLTGKFSVMMRMMIAVVRNMDLTNDSIKVCCHAALQAVENADDIINSFGSVQNHINYKATKLSQMMYDIITGREYVQMTKQFVRWTDTPAENDKPSHHDPRGCRYRYFRNKSDEVNMRMGIHQMRDNMEKMSEGMIHVCRMLKRMIWTLYQFVQTPELTFDQTTWSQIPNKRPEHEGMNEGTFRCRWYENMEGRVRVLEEQVKVMTEVIQKEKGANQYLKRKLQETVNCLTEKAQKLDERSNEQKNESEKGECTRSRNIEWKCIYCGKGRMYHARDCPLWMKLKKTYCNDSKILENASFPIQTRLVCLRCDRFLEPVHNCNCRTAPLVQVLCAYCNRNFYDCEGYCTGRLWEQRRRIEVEDWRMSYMMERYERYDRGVHEYDPPMLIDEIELESDWQYRGFYENYPNTDIEQVKGRNAKQGKKGKG